MDLEEKKTPRSIEWIADPVIVTYKYSQLVFDKGEGQFSGVMTVSLTMMLEQLEIRMQNSHLDTDFIPHTNSEWAIDLHVKFQARKV